MTERPLNFASAKEREEWILKHADYFTTSRMLNRVLHRNEYPTLEAAREAAKKQIAANAIKPVLIYAVQGGSSVYLEMVK